MKIFKLLLAAFFFVFIVLGYAENVWALTCGTKYYYRARSVDSAGNTATSSERSFTTTACDTGGGGTSGTGGAGTTSPTGTTTTATPTTTTAPTTTKQGQLTAKQTPKPGAKAKPGEPTPAATGQEQPATPVTTEEQLISGANQLATQARAQAGQLMPVELVARAAQATLTVAAAAMAAVAIAITASAPVAASVSNLLYRLLTRGFGVFGLLAWRRKRPWTEILDQTTGLPIAGATVTILETITSRAVAAIISDELGRVSVLIDKPGRYLIRVTHPSYQPWHSSEYVAKEPQQAIELPVITLLPAYLRPRLDPKEKVSQLLITLLTTLRLPILIAGTLLLLATAVLVEGSTTSTGFLLTVGVYFILWASELWVRTRPKPYGTVIDGKTKKPLERAIVRLLDSKTGKLVRTVVTGSKGRFQFLAPKGIFSLVVVHSGHQPLRRDGISLKGRQSLVHEVIVLEPT